MYDNRYQAIPQDNNMYDLRDEWTGKVVETGKAETNEDYDRIQATLDRKNEDFKDTRNAMENLFRRLNVIGNRDRIEDMILTARREHRTLQQDFTRVCIAWFEKLAKLEDYEYDLRMEASVKLAKAVTSTKEWQDGKYLPTI